MKTFLVVLFSFLIIFLVFLFWQRIIFNRWLEDGNSKILEEKVGKAELSLQPHPKLLQEYIKKVLPENYQTSCRHVRFNQSGLFRMNPEDKMSSFTASQVVSLVTPMFSWQADIASRGIPVTVCDRLIDGKGELEARLFGSIRVAKAEGPDLLRGELLRYLAEIPWYPYAVVNQSLIKWQQSGESTLLGSINIEGVSATVEYRLKDGLIHSIFVPDRGRTVGSKSLPTPWLGEFDEYKRIQGVLVPMYGEVSWLLPSGKFTYSQGKINDYELECK